MARVVSLRAFTSVVVAVIVVVKCRGGQSLSWPASGVTSGDRAGWVSSPSSSCILLAGYGVATAHPAQQIHVGAAH